MPNTDRRDADGRFAFPRKVAVAVMITALLVLLLLMVWYLAHVLLLVFGGLLVAVFLRGLADFVSSHLRIRHGVALLVVILGLLGVLIVTGRLMAPQVSLQLRELGEALPESLGQLEQKLRQYEWGARIADELARDEGLLAAGRQSFTRLGGLFTGLLGVLGQAVFVLVVGLYFAVRPEPYLRGIVRLLPRSGRERACHVLSALRHTLLWWLVGQATVMIFVGVAVTIGLALLGIPMALALGILAGLLDFVSYIGPIAAAVPAVLVALVQSPADALYVIVLYVIVQQVEGYVVAPIVQSRAVHLEPAVSITAQVALGLLVGPIGVLLAIPLTAAGLVVVKMLYLEDTLGERTDVAGADDAICEPQLF
jgi:Predicted permease